MRRPNEPSLFIVRAPASELDDAGLASAVANGDPQAPGAVWDRHAGVVRGVLRRSLGAQDVEDHVQEVFLRFFKRPGELRDPAALRCFLIGIAMRVAGTELRKRRVRRFLSLTADGDVRGPVTPPLDAEAREAVVRLYAILDRVDTETRLLFTLRHAEGLELTELAAVFEVSLATVKRRLSRATDKVFLMAQRDALLLDYLARGAHASRRVP
jgi:RNA polymerase sigma-70 factor (ECF subfamily)